MAFTPAEIIADARILLQDTSTTDPRYNAATMLTFVNSTVRRIALVRPDLFATIADMTTVLGVVQSAPSDSLRIIDVLNVVDGHNLNEVNRTLLDTLNPLWLTATPGSPTNWMRDPRNPNRFYVAGPATAGISISIEYAKSPAVLGQTDPIPLPDAFWPCVVDGVVWLAESVDNEHVNNGRAKMYADAFDKYLGITVQNRPLTDNSAAQLPPNTVPTPP